MRGGVLPPALVFVSLGLALTFSSRGAQVSSMIVLVAVLGVVAFIPVPQTWLEGAFLGCWISVIATAASVHFVRGLSSYAALVLSINAGVWASAVVSLSGRRIDVLSALPCVLICLPASRMVDRYGSIPVKVVASWVIAVAVLAAALQVLPVTPGYLPDHME